MGRVRSMHTSARSGTVWESPLNDGDFLNVQCLVVIEVQSSSIFAFSFRSRNGNDIGAHEARASPNHSSSFQKDDEGTIR